MLEIQCCNNFQCEGATLASLRSLSSRSASYTEVQFDTEAIHMGRNQKVFLICFTVKVDKRTGGGREERETSAASARGAL